MLPQREFPDAGRRASSFSLHDAGTPLVHRLCHALVPLIFLPSECPPQSKSSVAARRGSSSPHNEVHPLTRFLSAGTPCHPMTFDARARRSELAAVLGVENHTTDSRNGAKLDFVITSLLFARDAGFSAAQTLALHDLTLMLLKMSADPKVDFAAVEAAFQAALVSKVAATPTEGCFTVDDVKVISEQYAHGYFAHFRLYHFMYTEEQDVDQHKTVLRVETPFPFAPLVESLTEEKYEEKLKREAEEAVAAAAAKEEAEAAAKAEEEARLKAEEEARKAAEEEELAKRKPKNLDEAVEHAVRMKLAMEKAALEAEYAAREKQLLEKISVLEGQMGQA